VRTAHLRYPAAPALSIRGATSTLRWVDVVIRRAEATDADRRALAAVRRRWTEEDEGAPIDDPDFEARAAEWIAANESHRIGWLAEVGGEAVGMLTVIIAERMPQPGRPPSGWGYVHHLVVDVAQRGRGVGAALMDAAVAEASARGWSQLLLHPRPRSVPFYERAGFVTADLLVRRL
jgi:GNAT superfamily N-acetyltransferase